DPARPELHVVRELAPLDLALDQSLHLAQAFEDSVVEIAPVDERPHGRGVQLCVTLSPCDRASFDPGIALPVAAVALQVILERGKARRERPALSEWPQAHVHAEDESVLRARSEQPDELLSEPREEFLVGDATYRALARPGSAGVAVLRKQKDEIDIGGEIELAAAELAHGDDEERLLATALGTRLAVDCDEPRTCLGVCGIDRLVRESRQLRERLIERGPAGEV